MFDFAWSELALIGIVGLIFIGPKDMPTAIRTVTDLLKKGRKLAGEFQTHVDEMVRDADLGEARDSFQQLRTMNIRGQVMKALDGDGTLRRTLADNPLSPVPAASSSAIPGAAETHASSEPYVPGGQTVTGEELMRRRTTPPHVSRMALNLVPDAEEVPESEDPAPGIIPPSAAIRLRRLRAAAPAPAFLPPGALRPHSDLY
jgi:sec-independent protein translocase protein TatB